LVAKTGRFDRGVAKGRKGLNNFEKSAQRLGRTIGKLSGILGGLGVGLSIGGLIAMTRQAITLNDELGKFATRLGIATDQLKILQIAADLSGQKVNALTVGLQRMVRRVNEAAVGTGEAKQALIDLGLDARKLASQSPDQIFREIAERMEGVASQGQRIQLAFKLLDTEGVGLINTMKLLQSEGFDAVAQSARDMNAVLTDFETAQFEAAQDAVSLIGLAFEGIGNTISLALLPAVFIFRDNIVGVAEDAGTAQEEVAKIARRLVAGVGVIKGIIGLFNTFGNVIAAVGLRIQSFLLKPLDLVQRLIVKIINLTPGLEIDPETIGITKVKNGIDEMVDSLDNHINQYDGVIGEAVELVERWDEAALQVKAAAEETAKQRAELAKISEELQKQLEIRRKAAAEESARKQRETSLNSILRAGQAESLGIAQKIATINENLLSGEFIKTEEQRNAAIAARKELIDDLIEAQQKEQGLETQEEAAKKLQSILKRTTKDSLRIARDIAVLNEALIKGEGDRNQILEARKILVQELIDAQNEELNAVSKLTEVGLQTLRNMQDILADFFANTSGGFRGLLQGFTDMLKKMVAQLLARRILLSFLGLFAGGTSAFSGFARSAIGEITTRQRGGPLAAGQPAIVGESGPELFIPRSAGTVVPNRGGGSVVNIFQNNSFEGTGPLEPATLIPLLEENNRKLKGEFVDELRRGAFE
jgi:hypothetical protein